MFDISKIQEEIIYNAVKTESNDETAKKMSGTIRQVIRHG